MKENINIEIDSALKEKVEIIFKDYNLDLSKIITIFLEQVVYQKGISYPITLEIPNKKTIEAIKEYEKNRDYYHRYESPKELFDEINDHIFEFSPCKYHIVRTNAFDKDIDLAIKRGFDTSKLYDVIEMLADGKKLPTKYKDHSLLGKYEGFRECHIQNDWLLVYRIYEEEVELLLLRNGTHSDLF